MKNPALAGFAFLLAD